MEVHIFISILLLILAFLLPKSRVVSCFVFVYMWILWGWNRWNGDYDAYKLMFENSKFEDLASVGYEKGYFIINYFFSDIMNMSYESYMIFISFVILCSIWYLFQRYSKIPALLSLAYFFVFMMEYVFIRNYIVHFILILFFFRWFRGGNIKKYHYLIILFFCMNIHASAVFFGVFMYLFYVPVKILNVKKVIVVALVSTIFFIIFFNILLNNLGGFLFHKVAAYSTEGGLNNALIGLICLIGICLYYYLKCLDHDGMDSVNYSVMVYLVNFNLLCLFFTPIFYFIPYFARSFRLILTVDLIGMSMFIPYVYNNSIIRLRSCLLYVALIIFIIILFSKGTHEYESLPLFKVNDLIGDEYYNTNII